MNTKQRLVELLSELGDPIVAERHARLIHASVLGLCRGREIGRDDQGFYAKPRMAKPLGPAREMRDLAAAARKAIRGTISRDDWTRFWVGQSNQTSAIACMRFLFLSKERRLDEQKLLGSFSAPGYIIVVPKPEAVLAALEVLILQIKARTGNKKQRKPDAAARDHIVAIRSAYNALTGRRGGRVLPANGGPGRLVKLGRDIDGIFGLKVFPQVDSSRLKTYLGDKCPC